MAVLPLHTEHSHYVTPDVPVTFWSSLTILFAILIYKSGSSRWYWWAGVATGLTIGTKYNVGIVFLVVILAHFLTPKTQRGKFSWLVKSGLLALLIFLVTTPFAVLDLSGFLDEMAFQVRHYTILGHGTASDEASWSAYLSDFWNEAFVKQASFAALGGIGLALWRQRREDWLVLALPALGYLFFSAAKVHFSRNLMPLLPPLALLAALFLLEISRFIFILSKLSLNKGRNAKFLLFLKGNLTAKATIMVILWLVFFGFALQNSFLTDHYYLQPDTRIQAGQWLVANVQAGAKLRMEHGAPLLPTDRYQDVNEQRPIGGHDLEWYKQQGFNYLVASSYEYRVLMADDAQANQNYQALFAHGKLVAKFAGDSPDHPGPTILVYKIDT
jgi:4-amino-4-deoxy-L-arabinose transferase-like glycosyltransferase